MNIVDALFVTFGLDPSDYDAGVKRVNEGNKKLNESSDKTAQNLEQLGKRGAKALGRVRNGVLALTATVLGGMGFKQFVQTTVRSNAELGRLAENLGINVEHLSAFANEAEKAGATKGDMAGAFASLVKFSQEYRQFGSIANNGRIATWLQKAGVSFNEFDKNLKSGDAVAQIKLVADAMQRLDARDGQSLLSDLGISESLGPMLRVGRSELGRLVDLQLKSAAANKTQTENARALSKAWADLVQKVDAVLSKMLYEWLPAITKAVDWMSKYSTEIAHAVVVAGTLIAVMSGAGMVSMLASMTKLLGLATASGAALSSAAAAAGLLARAVPAIAALGAGWWVGSKIRNWWDLRNHTSVDSSLTPETRRRLAAGEDKRADSGPQGTNTKTLFGGIEQRYGLPPGLLDSMWAQESGRGKFMRSHAGAEGHFQFMRATARQYGLDDPYDLTESAKATGRKMSDLMRRYDGNVSRALAAYNWGEGNVDKWMRGQKSMPSETANYAPQILARMGQPGAGASSRTDVNIQNVTVNTKATDAKGIARDFAPAVRDEYQMMAQSSLSSLR